MNDEQELMEEINRLARLCKAKDAEYNELDRHYADELADGRKLRQQLSEAQAQIAMQAEQRHELEGVLEDIKNGLIFDNTCASTLERVIENLAATPETVAAFRAKETEPLREQIKFLSDWKEKAMAHMTTTDALIEPLRREVAMLRNAITFALVDIEGDDWIGMLKQALSDTQATALAYEREVEAKALEEAATELDNRHLESLQMCILPSTMVREMAAELRANKGEVK